MIWDFIKSFVIPAAVSGGFAWLIFAFLGKKFIEQRLSKDIKRFEAELSEKTAALKTQLSIFAHEQNVVATRIDAQRAEAIKCIYTAICEWKTPTEKLIGDCPVLDPDPEFDETPSGYYLDRAREAHAAGKALIQHLENQAIYFDTDFFEKMYATVYRVVDAVATIVKSVDEGITVGMDYEDVIPEAMRQRQQLKPIYNEQFMPLFEEIVAEFRLLLGSMKG